MALQQIDTSGGQVSGVDDLSAAASVVMNWETDESGINRPRPGLVSYSTTGAGSSASIGLCRWKNYLIDVTADRYVRVLPDSTPTTFEVVSTSSTATQVSGSAPRASFAIGDQYVYIVAGGQIQRWSNSTALPPDTIAASPLQATHIAALGQRLIVNDRNNPSSFFWSDIGEGTWTAWPAANVSNADARPDPIAGIYENTNELFVFGTETLQVYALGSDPTLPFDTVNAINTGLAAPYAVCRMDESFYFLDDKLRLVNSDGRSVQPISDAIQRDLRGLSTISDCWLYREERAQQSSLVVRFPTAKRTFRYDLKAQKWSERDYYVAPFHADFPVSSYLYWPAYNYHMFGSTLSGAGLLRFDENTRGDLGNPLVCERTTGWHDFGTANYKRFGRLRVVMRRGTAAQGATPGALEVRVQNDDGPWSSWRRMSVGAPEDYSQVMDTFELAGVARRRRYGFRFSTTENISLVSAHDDATELTA